MVENRNSIAKSFIVLSVFLIVLFCLPFLLRLAGAQSAKTGESLVPGDSGVSPVPGVEKLNLIDKGDFYYLNSGEKVSFLRAQKTFAMVYHQKHPRAKELRKSVGKKFKDKIFLAPDRPSNRHFLFSIEEGEGQEELIHQLKRSDNSIRFISPVLTRKNNGRSELAVVPSIIVRIANAFAPDVVLSRLSTKYNLEIASRLAFTDKEYLLDIKEDIVDIGRIFSITRACAEDPGVEWAEPNFLETPQMQFTPNDTLYSNQWHLHNYRDADIDAPEGWDISKGNGAIIAIIDQGVDTSHPDLAIWSNPGETGLDSNNNDKRFNGNDDDNNGYIDDHQGWDFNSQDNDPNPLYPNQAHGTAAAGVAGAIGGNNQGVAGSAIQATILPIRFGASYCSERGDMMRYAGMYADVVNNSWTATACESELNAAIDDVVSGNLSGARRGVYGSPVLFATGNKAGGWRKFSVDVSAGSHTFRWRFVKDASNSEGHDKVWLDDIDWGEDDITDFEDDTIGVMPGGFGLSGHAVWSVVSDGIHARNRIGNSVQSGVIGNDQHTDLISTREVGAGEVSFWVWVSCEAKNSATYRDRFEFYVDDILEIQSAPGQYDQHVDSVGYPASNADTIAVGASNDGVWSGADERSHYSQFGHELDVVAPSSGGEESITTTDNTDADGYNDGTGDDLSNLDYTNTFGGTSSATPLVSGVVASLLSYRSMLTVEEVRTILHHSAEKIGPYSYNGGRNDYYGYGKVSFPYAVGQVWVDFLQTGSQTGSPSHGFNSVGVAAQTVPAGGLMVIKAGTTSEKPILDRKMTVRSTGGNVVIGYP